MVVRGLMLTIVAINLLLGQGWVGQQWIGRRDSTADITAFIAIGRLGQPWATWSARSETTLMYSKWLGDSWALEHGVGPDLPGIDSRLAPSICFDGQDRVWIAWDNYWPNNTSDVASRYLIGNEWNPEIQVNHSDSNNASGPRLASGGGRLWCVFECFPDISSMEYSVFASCWDEDSQVWGPEMQVSPADGRTHWWSSVAVDQQGRPHVVWCIAQLYAVFYSYYTGDTWSCPIIIHDTTRVTASPFACPRIEIDREGILHTCFTGAYRGASFRDIFYTRNNGSGWDTCQLVTRDVVYDEWYSDIAGDRPDNVWVVWDRQGEGPDQFRVYASRFDGKEWSPEERLDNDTAYYDHYPQVCLDLNGNPWVVWNGMPNGTSSFDIFYNRYFIPLGVEQPYLSNLNAENLGLTVRLISPRRVKFYYNLPSACQLNLSIFDRTGRQVWNVTKEWLGPGQHITEWNRISSDGKFAPAGIYFCRLSAAGKEETCSFVLLK